MSRTQRKLDELKRQIAEIREATVEEEGKPSLPAGSLQRGIESAARMAGLQDPGAAWGLTKDVGRAFVPQTLEALARNKLRGEDYEDAAAKAEEAREDLTNARPGLAATGSATQSAVGVIASVALYAKLAGGSRAAAAAPAPAPAAAPAAAPVGRIAGVVKSGGKLALVAGAGAAIGAWLSSGAKATAQSAPPAPAPAPTPAPKTGGRPQAAAKPARSGGPIEVPAHARADGTQVKAHTRQRRD